MGWCCLTASLNPAYPLPAPPPLPLPARADADVWLKVVIRLVSPEFGSYIRESDRAGCARPAGSRTSTVWQLTSDLRRRQHRGVAAAPAGHAGHGEGHRQRAYHSVQDMSFEDFVVRRFVRVGAVPCPAEFDMCIISKALHKTEALWLRWLP